MLVWIALSALLTGSVTAFRQQSVGVKGQLMCGDKPAAGELIKVINHNSVGFDDQLGTAKTDEQGYYTLQGSLGSMLSLDVKFKIYTDCNDGITPCKREISFGIPSKYVTRTDAVQNFFNGGSLNLQFEFKDEDRSCLN